MYGKFVLNVLLIMATYTSSKMVSKRVVVPYLCKEITELFSVMFVVKIKVPA